MSFVFAAEDFENLPLPISTPPPGAHMDLETEQSRSESTACTRSLYTVNQEDSGALQETRAAICDPLATAKGFGSNDSSHDD